VRIMEIALIILTGIMAFYQIIIFNILYEIRNQLKKK